MKKFMTIALAALVFVGCNDTPEPDPIVPVLDIEAVTVDAPAEGVEDFEIFVNSNLAWAVVPSAEWIEVLPAEGEGESIVYINVAANETYDAREASVTISLTDPVFAEQVPAVTIPVTQEAKKAMVVGQSRFEVGAEGETVEINLSTNVEYEVTFDVDWLSLEETTRGLEEKVVRVVVAANETYDPREGVITITSELGSDKIRVKQEEARTVEVDAEEQELFPAEGGQVTFTVSQNMDYDVEITAEWITKAKGSRALETDELVFDVAANETPDVRVGYIIVTSEVQTDSIKVAQAGSAEAVVEIKDGRLARMLRNAYDTNEDQELTLGELAAVKELSLVRQASNFSWISEGITDLSDLKYMPNIEKLNISFSNIEAVNLSVLPNLTWLCANNTKLTALDLSKNTELTYLDLGASPIASLDLSNNTKLVEAQLSGMALTALDVTALKDLKVLNVAYNKISTLDVSNNIALEGLYVNGNALTELNVSALSALKRLNCEHNQITALNVTANSQLVLLNCGRNALTSLNVSGLANLVTLSCPYNTALTSLDLSGLAKLRNLYAHHAGLTSLSTASCPELGQVHVNDNALTGYDFSANSLRGLCIDGNNPLTGSIDISKTSVYNTLKYLYADVASLSSIKIPSWINTYFPIDHIHKNEATKFDGGFYLEPLPVDLSENATSNCYIINKADTLYKFKATVKGNGVAALGDDVTEIAPAKARLLWAMSAWQMNEGDEDNDWPSNLGNNNADKMILATSVTLTEDGYIEFATGSDMPDGNAVIVATDDSGNILWSWHIWAIKGYEPAAEDHYVTTHGLNVYMMDRNLGATSDVSDIAEPTMGDYIGTRGLYYQRGRKDPFYGSIKFNGYAAKLALFAEDGSFTTPYAIYGNDRAMAKFAVADIPGWSGLRSSIDFTIANPMAYLTSGSKQGYSWLNTAAAESGQTTEWGKLWGNQAAEALGGVKTMYDPCPVGYSVPAPGKFAFITSHQDDATAYYNNNAAWKYNCREQIFADTLNADNVYPAINTTFKQRPYGMHFYIHGAKTPAEVEEGAQNYGVEPDDKTVAYFPVTGHLNYGMSDYTYSDWSAVTAFSNAPTPDKAYGSGMNYFMSANYAGDFYRYNYRSMSYGDQQGKAMPVRCFREN
ncbi:MAG: hypothetical protein IJ014_05275 [Rikenellaceae bacterium]|nr:hypothetical protein [Rikenellaceae bacterium]